MLAPSPSDASGDLRRRIQADWRQHSRRLARSLRNARRFRQTGGAYDRRPRGDGGLCGPEKPQQPLRRRAKQCVSSRNFSVRAGWPRSSLLAMVAGAFAQEATTIVEETVVAAAPDPRLRRHRLDADVDGAGPADDDPRPGAVLLRHGAQEGRAGDGDAELRLLLPRHRPVDDHRLQPRLHRRRRACRPTSAASTGCSCPAWRSTATHALARDHSRSRCS